VYSGLKLITSNDLTPIVFFHGRISKAEKISNRITLINHLYAGAVNGDSIPSQYMFFTGGNMESYRNGIMPFAGLDFMEIASKNTLSLKMDIQLRLFGKIYMIGAFNAGNFTNSFNDLFTTDKILAGYGLTGGYQSIIGPIELSVSRSVNHGGFEAFFRIGYWF
jgi:NTE family protein